METPPGVELCSELHSLFFGQQSQGEQSHEETDRVPAAHRFHGVRPPAAMAAQPNQTVGNWYDDAMSVWAQRGVLKGDGSGSLNPTGYITRGEAAVMLDNMFAETFDKAGTYTEDVDSSAVISADDVTLQGITVAGDLIVAEGVADGHVVLDGVTVEGKLIVRGGGTNSVVIKGDSKVDVVTVAKGAVVSDLTVSGSDAALAVAGKVEQVSVTKEADGVSIQTEKGSKIDSVVTSGSNTTVEGSGTVTKVEAPPTPAAPPSAPAAPGWRTTAVTPSPFPAAPCRSVRQHLRRFQRRRLQQRGRFRRF